MSHLHRVSSLATQRWVISSKRDAADEKNETMSVMTFGLTSLVVAAGDGPGG
jgi:hypothetical protein